MARVYGESAITAARSARLSFDSLIIHFLRGQAFDPETVEVPLNE
jgi:hypothetical protein